MSQKAFGKKLLALQKNIALWKKLYKQAGEDTALEQLAADFGNLSSLLSLTLIGYTKDPFQQLKQLWKAIKSVEGIRLFSDEQQQNYKKLLEKFLETYSELKEQQQQKLAEKRDYIQQELRRIGGIIDNKPNNQAYEDRKKTIIDSAKGNRFRITIGFAKNGDTLGRIEYLYNILQPNDAKVIKDEEGEDGQDGVIIDYWDYIPDENGGSGTFAVKEQLSKKIKGELTLMLIDMALKQLTPAPSPIPAPDKLSMYGSGAYYLCIRQPAEPCMDYHVAVTDIVTGQTTDSCGNVVAVVFDRVATQVPNPNCDKQTWSYSNLITNNQQYSSPPQQYNLTGGGQGNLPANTVASPNFDLDTLNAYFESNPNASSYTESFSVAVVPPPIITDGTTYPIAVNFWTAAVTNPANALATLQPVIDFLNYYCNSSVTILGQLQWMPNLGDPRVFVYPAAARTANSIPASIVNPIDYIFVKGQNVANVLTSSGRLNDSSQVVVPTRGSIPFSQLVISPVMAVGLSVIVSVNFIPND